MSALSSLHVIFLHAFPLDGSMWDGQRGVLPVSVSAPNLYSLGDSMETWASRALETVPGKMLLVVGCSMGGSCALEMARQAGDRIAALVLIGSKASHRPEPGVRDGYVGALREGGLERVWPGLEARFFGPKADPGIVTAARTIAQQQSTENLIRAVQVFHGRPDAADVVTNWRKPLLVIGGDQDGVVSVKKSAALAESAPYGRLHIMRGCGHLANMEHPAEFNTILGDCVRSVMGAKLQMDTR